jgi:hypothetical protein
VYSVENEKPVFDPSSVSKRLATYSASVGGAESSDGDQLIDGKSFNHFKFPHLQDGKIK